MKFLQRLPNSQRAPSGWEWVIWQRLPRIWGWGSLLFLALFGACHWAAGVQTEAAAARDFTRWSYEALGLLILHWTLALTLTFGCLIVIVMKGPAYGADVYPPPDREDGALRD